MPELWRDLSYKGSNRSQECKCYNVACSTTASTAATVVLKIDYDQRRKHLSWTYAFILLLAYSLDCADNWLSRFDNHTKLIALLRHPRFKLVTDLCMPSRLKMGTTTFKHISKACPNITYLNIANAKNCKTLQLMEIANCMPNLHTFIMGEATGKRRTVRHGTACCSCCAPFALPNHSTLSLQSCLLNRCSMFSSFKHSPALVCKLSKHKL
jgi:hypothetical protein